MGFIPLLVPLLISISCCYGGKMVVYQKPSYLDMIDNGEIMKLSDIEHLISDLFGFHTHKEISYRGFISPPPFHSLRASAIITLFGDGALLDIKGPSVEIKADDFIVSTHKLEHNLRNFYTSTDGAESNIVKLHLDVKANDFDGILENLQTDSDTTKAILQKNSMNIKLNESNEEIDSYLLHLSLILQSLDALVQNGAGPADLLAFELNIPKSASESTRNALNALLSQLLLKTKEVMTTLYGDDTLILVVNWAEYQTASSRKTRSLMALDQQANTTGLNLAEAWSSDYPAIFNIILWLMISLALLVIYVVHGFFTSDPGSDSIIYRMTNTRMKKDN